MLRDVGELWCALRQMCSSHSLHLSWSPFSPDRTHTDGEAGLMPQSPNLLIESSVHGWIPDFEIVKVLVDLRQVFTVCHAPTPFADCFARSSASAFNFCSHAV